MHSEYNEQKKNKMKKMPLNIWQWLNIMLFISEIKAFTSNNNDNYWLKNRFS
jgi:hypothetical protein